MTVGRKGFVYYDGMFAGILSQIQAGFQFSYDGGYLLHGIPVGFCFPLQDASFISDELFPFFENLVSEGWLKQIQSRAQRIDENDRFGLLLENGRDLIGAVTVLKEKDAAV